MTDHGPDTSPDLLQRMVGAVERVRQRLLLATNALRSSGLNYAVVGGNAVAAWVGTVDPTAIRNTPYVDILIRCEDFALVKIALEASRFVHRSATNVDLFLEYSTAKPRDSVRIFRAGAGIAARAHVEESTDFGLLRVLNLDPLVRFSLLNFLPDDRLHVRDLIDVGLVDQSWTSKLPSALAARLQSLLDTPDS